MIDREIHLYYVNLDNQLQFTPEIQLNIKSLFKNFKFLLNISTFLDSLLQIN